MFCFFLVTHYYCNLQLFCTAPITININEPQSRFARLWLDMIIAQSDAHNFDAARSMLNSLTQIQKQRRSSRRPMPNIQL